MVGKMLRITLKAETQTEARLQRAALIATLQTVADDGQVPSVLVETMHDDGGGMWFVAEVNCQ
jgi:hypothetical protein